MSDNIHSLMPSIAALSHADKYRLAHLLLAELARDESLENENKNDISQSLRGCLKQYARPELIETEAFAWQSMAGEKHEHR